MPIRILFFLMIISTHGFCQTLPVPRSVNWSQEVVPVEIAEPSRTIDFASFYSAQTDPNEALLSIFSVQAGSPSVIYFENGVYHFTKPIRLPAHTILRGASSDSTVFRFDLDSESHLISVQGNASTDTALNASFTTIFSIPSDML